MHNSLVCKRTLNHLAKRYLTTYFAFFYIMKNLWITSNLTLKAQVWLKCLTYIFPTYTGIYIERPEVYCQLGVISTLLGPLKNVRIRKRSVIATAMP